MAKAEGLTLPFDDPEKVRVDLLETFPYEGERQFITYETAEFSAVCPYSGLPDYGDFIMEYVPNGNIVELKSLKYYITSYRNIGIYQEDATNKLFQDLYKLLNPTYLKITTIYNPRGGIDTTCEIEKGTK
ncbi:NADPH-dependent 7-cyano-7-deazaguanine reductase QueF [bacterium]|jgi:7-cyano-7-deazaguanine reductase|nr:NADPH-dependent 7-cyano-7-deazaguanine reductase QueF [bacterium]